MMVGTVISADMDTIGQMPPNSKVRFVNVTLDESSTPAANEPTDSIGFAANWRSDRQRQLLTERAKQGVR